MTGKTDLGALFGASDVTTFLGLDACDDLEDLRAPIALIGAPCATLYASVGPYCRNAPDALRAAVASMSANADRHNFDLGGPVFPVGHGRAVDCGDLPFDVADSVGNRAGIADAVTTILGKGAVPIVLGGDDSIPIPMLQAFESTGETYTILQLDAHIDWRTSHMGEAMGLSSTMRRASEMDHIGRIIQVGARGIGSAATSDFEDALAWGVSFVTAEAVHAHGAGQVANLIPEGSGIIICLDVDVLDPSVVPGVIGRTPGGLSYFQTLDLIRAAASRGRIAGADVVEFMPEADVDGLGALTVSRLIVAMMGVIARQN